MIDKLTKLQRSSNMARVHSRDTAPELFVRREIFAEGFRYRIAPKLAGKPDIVLSRYRTAVFVHGCFWHGHSCARGARPKSNTEFWDRKLAKNIERDARAVCLLESQGWTVVTIWTCQLSAGTSALIRRLRSLRRQRDAPQ